MRRGLCESVLLWEVWPVAVILNEGGVASAVVSLNEGEASVPVCLNKAGVASVSISPNEGGVAPAPVGLCRRRGLCV